MYHHSGSGPSCGGYPETHKTGMPSTAPMSGPRSSNGSSMNLYATRRTSSGRPFINSAVIMRPSHSNERSTSVSKSRIHLGVGSGIRIPHTYNGVDPSRGNPARVMKTTSCENINLKSKKAAPNLSRSAADKAKACSRTCGVHPF